MSENRIIGRGNRLPWRLPKEMAHFVRVTMGKPVIMGRKTFSALKKPLAGRDNIVVSRSGFTSTHPSVCVVRSLEEALQRSEHLALINGVDEVMVAGGAEIYRLALPRAQRLYKTVVHAVVEGDVTFPDYDEAAFETVGEQHVEADAENSHAFSVYVLDRRA